MWSSSCKCDDDGCSGSTQDPRSASQLCARFVSPKKQFISCEETRVRRKGFREKPPESPPFTLIFLQDAKQLLD